MENNSVLYSRFETAYSEFKKYGAFYFEFLKDFRQKRAEQDKFLLDNMQDEEKTKEYILDYLSLPNYYAKDLDRLKERTICIFEVVEDLIEISPEIRAEMHEIIQKKNPILFNIVEGKAVAVDESIIEDLKKEVKNYYIQLVKNIKVDNV